MMIDALGALMMVIGIVSVHLERSNFWLGGPLDLWRRSGRLAVAAKLLILTAIPTSIAAFLIDPLSVPLLFLGMGLMVFHLVILAFLKPPRDGWRMPKWQFK